MERISTLKKTKEIIQQHGFKFSKSLGQNFLIDPNILTKIIDGANLSKEDYVIEIGPGIGGLTQGLAERAKGVVAVEIDKALIPILKKTLQDCENVEIIHADILKLDMKQLIREKFHSDRVKVIGNLPYYITTPIIMKFLEGKVPVKELIIMIQKEVADRMGAKPGTKDYGALSIAVQYYCNTKIITKVPPSVFIPQPKVESTVIKLEVLEAPRVDVEREDLFFALIRDAFGKRRKTLLNALSTGQLKLTKEQVREILFYCGIQENRRGETLTIEEFAALANCLAKRL